MHIFSFFLLRENGRHAKSATPSMRKSIFQGARLRRCRRQGKEKHTIIIRKQLPNMKKNHISYFFRAARPCHDNAPKMTSHNPSGTLLGTPWRPQGLPRSGRERPRSDPGGSQERPRSVPGATFPATSAPEAAQRPPGSHFGAILESFWLNFHSFLLSFSPPRRRIFQRLQSHVSHMCAAFVSLFSKEPHAKATQTQIKKQSQTNTEDT